MTGRDYIQMTEYDAVGRVSRSAHQDANRYKYGGKDWESRNGLNWYDFSARPYDPATLRFTTTDPLALQNSDASPYMYCHANPTNRIDPTGMTDYHGLDGTVVKHVDDGSDNHMLLLYNGNEETEIDNAISQGYYLPVPTEEIINAMETAYKKTEKTENEHYFRVGEKGTVSSVVEGTKEDISFDIIQRCADEIVDAGDRVSYEVHTHPHTYLNSDVKRTDVPSEEDLISVNGKGPSVILGYRSNEVPQKKISSQRIIKSHRNYDRYIVFYDKRGIINGSNIKYSTFINGLRKIYKGKK